MKSKMVTPPGDALLRKSAISETIIDQLRNISQIEHTQTLMPHQLLYKHPWRAVCLPIQGNPTLHPRRPARYKTTIFDVRD
jgi:hypothetical protein